jgi:hypothetical protein
MELLEFLLQTQQDVLIEMEARSDNPGDSLPFAESVFTEIVSKHMFDNGMTFEPYICYFSAKVGSANLRLNGYALSEDGDELDLYVSLYEGVSEIVNIPDAITKKAVEQCFRFFKACVEGKLDSKMDDTHDAYPLVMTIKEVFAELEQIRIYVLTDKRAKTRQFKHRESAGKTVKLEVMDIERLYNHWQSGKPRDELLVDFEAVSGAPLPCIWVENDMEEYNYAMTVIPGNTLNFLYEKYGHRILEANVRSFLSQTGKVNKGIRDTLRNDPERFMAYNNGIVIVADDVRISRSEEGSPGIAWLKGLQIVNGGQTTASMFFTKKKYPGTDLSKVRVPAKIIILGDADEAQEEALISDIALYANTQNVVRQSDLSANKPYHIQIEKLANSTFCPDGVNRWFYERSTGSYKVTLEREGKTPAGIKRLRSQIPTTRKIIKTDLAKFMLTWLQKPDLVSLGGQKNFAAFMKIVSPEIEGDIPLPDSAEFKRIIAQVIIYKSAYKIIRPRFPAFMTNIANYTVSVVSLLLSDQIDLTMVWDKQSISQELGEQIAIWSDQVSDYLHETSEGRMISEWSKNPECWETLKRKNYHQTRDIIPELQKK